MVLSNVQLPILWRVNYFDTCSSLSRLITSINSIKENDFALFAKSSAQAKSLLHNLEQQAEGIIRLYVNTKQELMCSKQEGTISTLSSKPLKLVDQFTNLGSNITSTESEVNICLTKGWTFIDNLLIIRSLWWNKTWFVPSCNCVSTIVSIHHLDTNKIHGKKGWMGTTHECYLLFWTNPGSRNSQNSNCTTIYLPSPKSCWAQLGK